MLDEIIENKADYEGKKLALFDFSKNEKVCYVLKNLGYCEEFTDYVIMNTYDWDEGDKQDFYFELAKKLKGWGKMWFL